MNTKDGSHERPISKSEWRYRTILDTIGEGYFEVDLKGNLTFFNDALCNITGYNRSELLGRNNRDFVDVETARKMFRIFSHIYKTGQHSPVVDFKGYRKNGTPFVLELSASPMQDAGGETVGFRGVMRDISARKKTMDALKESEERYRTVMEANPDPVVVFDMTGTVLYFNPAFTRVFGWELEERIGHKLNRFVPEENRPETAVSFAKLSAGESFSGVESRRLTKDGRVIPVSMNGAVYRDPNGSIAGCLITLRDITEHKRLQAQLQHAQKMEAIGTLTSGVAHNFRNILTGISVNSQLIQMKYPDHPAIMDIEKRNDKYVRRGTQLVAELMKFSHRKRKSLGPINLSDVVWETYQLISKSFDKMINISINIPENLPIVGDHSGLSQVLINICTNARDAMPYGGKLHITAQKDGQWTRMIISDTGVGMDAETQEKCFDPFFTTKDVTEGTGLGLSTTYGIIKDHGGDIRVVSEQGMGASFEILLPLAETETTGREETKKEILRGNGQKILVVDDETEMLSSIKELLEAMGYRAVAVTRGSEAVAEYQYWKPSAVLLDRNMPEMDGVACARRIARHDPAANIVLISGYEANGPHGIDEKTRAIIKGYMTKPLEIAELSHVLCQLCSGA